MPANIDSHQDDPFHCDCFACGRSNPNGLQLHFETHPDGTASADWKPDPEYRSYPDRIHGGIVAILIDSAMVHALRAGGIHGITAEMNIRYMQRANPEDIIRVTGRVLSSRHGLHLCQADVYQAETRIARARAKFMTLPATQAQDSFSAPENTSSTFSTATE